MGRFTGKVALVTGSGRGIGRAIAVRLAQEGANILINDLHTNDDSTETIKQVEATGAKAHFVEADISKVDSVKAMVAEGITTFGQIDILVNNAGIEIRAPFWEVTEQQYDIVMAVNLKGAFFVA